MPTVIKQIPASETYSVRHPVLRPGKPIGSCHFDSDHNPGTIHYGLFESGILAAVATVVPNRHVAFRSGRQFQLRGMAVLHEYQNKGVGAQLLQYIENELTSSADLLWFNARIIAVGFYQKSGYIPTGDVFDIGDIGPHYVMYKHLNG